MTEKADISPGLRDRGIAQVSAFAAAAVAMGIAGVVLDPAAGNQATWFLFLLAIGWLTWRITRRVVGYLLHDRYLTAALESPPTRLRPSRGNTLPPHVLSQVAALEAHGFVPGSHPVTAVVGDDLMVGGPYVMITHATEPIAGWVGLLGPHFVSALADGRMFTTNSYGLCPHPMAVTQVIRGAVTPDELLQHHRQGLAFLAQRGATAVRHDCHGLYLHSNALEREVLVPLPRRERIRFLNDVIGSGGHGEGPLAEQPQDVASAAVARDG